MLFCRSALRMFAVLMFFRVRMTEVPAVSSAHSSLKREMLSHRNRGSTYLQQYEPVPESYDTK